MRNKIICSIFSTVLAIGLSHSAKAQPDKDYIERKGWSLGMTLGNSDLWGDIGTNKMKDHYLNDNYSKHMRPFGGLYVRYTLHPAFVLRGGINYGMLSAADNMNVNLAKKAVNYESDSVQRYQRNLDVRVNVWEGNFMFEINPLRFSTLSRMAKMHFQPYLLAGITGYHFQSKGRYINKNGAGASNGQWINLYDLHIEGDGFKEAGMPAAYSRWQIAVPLGIGGKWDLSPKMALGIEYVYRYCMTDYLDGVSQNYIDPTLYAKNGLTPEQVVVATAMADKSWELDKNKVHTPGQKRGSNAGADSYSTISLTLFYKFKSRAYPWWE